VVNCLKLNISNLRFHIDLSGLNPRVFRKMASVFSPFISNNGQLPHETLEVVPLRSERNRKEMPGLEALVRKSLQIPLYKFPFPADPEKEIEYSMRDLWTFSGDERYRLFFKELKNPGEMMVYPLSRGCLLRRQQAARSVLFLQAGFFQRPRIESIREATYIATSMALPLVDCVMLHGVGIRRDGIGHLFLGNSGSGKSTLALFSPPEEVISDDGIIVERAGSDYHLAPAPIDQSSSHRSDVRRGLCKRARLSAGFFLQKDSRVYLERVLPSEACSIILKNHIHYFRFFPQEGVEKTFSLISGVCRHVPFYRLHFRKDPSFWPMITEETSRIIQGRGDSDGLK